MWPMASCYHCGASIPEGVRLERSSECSACKRDLRVCMNCKHRSPGAHWDCRETVPEAVHDKERRNFCEYFALSNTEADNAKKNLERDRMAKARFEALFREGPAE